MPEAASLALEQMNGVMIGGRNIKVCCAHAGNCDGWKGMGSVMGAAFQVGSELSAMVCPPNKSVRNTTTELIHDCQLRKEFLFAAGGQTQQHATSAEHHRGTVRRGYQV